MKKKYTIIVICILIGCFLIFANFYYCWKQFNFQSEESINFISWLLSDIGMDWLFETLYDLGIGFIGSAIFLVLVDWTLEHVENKIINATNLDNKRREIAKGMRYSPEQTLEVYRLHGNLLSLFTDQFFQGCKWSGLKLDGLDLSKSDLTNSDLSNSSLVDTNLSNCILSGVNLNGAKLTYANFTGTNISEAQLRVADSLWNSIMPNGEKYDGRFMLKGDIKEAKQYGYDILNDENAKKLFYSKKEK